MASVPLSTLSSPLSSPYPGPSVLSVPSTDSISPYAEESNGAICRWNGCGKRFAEYRTLAEHLGSDHLDASGPSVVCQWEGCSHRGHPLSSPEDLRSHALSHIDVAELSNTTRSRDAIQITPTSSTYHQTSIPWGMDDRSGRKRKRESNSHHSPTSPNPKRIVPNDRPGPSGEEDPQLPGFVPTSPDHIPTSLEQHAAPDGSIMGRPREQVRYLIVKAKLQHLTDENELMKTELRNLRRQEERLIKEKDALLNDVMMRELGPQAMQLVNEPALPDDGSLGPWVTFTAKGVDFT